MNVGSSGEGEDAVISAINTTPLVDVMLVMLIIFLITIPVVTTSVPVTLPKERVEIRETKPENIIISVDTAGSVFWYDQKITSTEALVDKLKKVSKLDPQPEVQIRGDYGFPVRRCRQDPVRLPARRHCQSGVHHRTPRTGWLKLHQFCKETQNVNECRKFR
jgi:biopolymer transport protein ExbD